MHVCKVLYIHYRIRPAVKLIGSVKEPNENGAFAVETSGVLGEAAEEFVGKLGRRLCKTTGEPRSHEYLLQRSSIAMQRGNAAAVLGTMGRPQPDSWE